MIFDVISIVRLLYLTWLVYGYDDPEAYIEHIRAHTLLLISIHVLHFHINEIYFVSCRRNKLVKLITERKK